MKDSVFALDENKFEGTQDDWRDIEDTEDAIGNVAERVPHLFATVGFDGIAPSVVAAAQHRFIRLAMTQGIHVEHGQMAQTQFGIFHAVTNVIKLYDDHTKRNAYNLHLDAKRYLSGEDDVVINDLFDFFRG